MNQPRLPHGLSPCWLAAAGGLLAASVCLAGPPTNIDYLATPIQSYATLDLSTGDAKGHPVELIALDDQNNAAFAYNPYASKDSSIYLKQAYNIETWKNGVLTDGARLPAQGHMDLLCVGFNEGYTPTITFSLYPTFLVADGTVFGATGWSFGGPGWSFTTSQMSWEGPCFKCRTTPAPDAIPFYFQADAGDYSHRPPWQNGVYFPTAPMRTQLYAVSSLGSMTAGISGDHCLTTKPPATPPYQTTGDAVVWAGNLVWDSNIYYNYTPTYEPCVPDDPNVVNGIPPYYVSYVNEQGWATTSTNWDGNNQLPPYYLWNPVQRQLTPLDNVSTGLNDSNDVLVCGTYDAPTNRYNGAYLVEQGNASVKEHFLATGPGDKGLIPALYQSQIRDVYPFLMSNRVTGVDPATQPAQPVLNILFKAEVRRSVAADDWEDAAFLLRKLSDGTTDLQEVTSLRDYQCVAINTGGVIAAIGDPGTGGSHALLLLPVDVINSKGDILSTLKIANMATSGVLTGSINQASGDLGGVVLNPDPDPDCYYIRVRGGAKTASTCKVSVETRKNPDSSYDDPGNDLQLNAKGNDLVSKSLLLTSDSVDNYYQVDGITNDALNDRTHRIQLGGKFRIKNIQIGSLSQATEIDYPAQAKKHLQFRITILRLTPGGSLVADPASVSEDIKLVQERYAQAGIAVDATVRVADPPAGVDLSDGVTVNNVDAAGQPVEGYAPELLAIGEGLGTDSTADIDVYYVNRLLLVADLKGIKTQSIISGVSIPEDTVFPWQSKSGNSSFISSDEQHPFTLAHELVHLLQPARLTGEDAQGHWPASESVRLMRDQGTSITNTVGSSKRLTPDEIAAILQSPLLQ